MVTFEETESQRVQNWGMNYLGPTNIFFFIFTTSLLNVFYSWVDENCSEFERDHFSWRIIFILHHWEISVDLKDFKWTYRWGWNKGKTKFRYRELSGGQFRAGQVDSRQHFSPGLGIWSTMDGWLDLFLLPRCVHLALDVCWSKVSEVGSGSCPKKRDVQDGLESYAGPSLGWWSEVSSQDVCL